MEKFLQLTTSGIAVGGIYAIAALGFVLIYKATRVINFAQGALMMLGGYLGFAFAASWALPIPLAFLLSALVVGAVRAGHHHDGLVDRLHCRSPILRRPASEALPPDLP
jgi:branched-subunit amino acid ABC-type transport system permease component